jgi:hypothetical protein
MAHLLHNAVRFLRGWLKPWGRRESYYLLARRIGPHPESAPQSGPVDGLEFICSQNQPRLRAFLEFSETQGLPAEWCLAELDRGLAASIALARRAEDSPPEVAAAGWVTAGEHWVDDLFHWFDPTSQGVQLLNVYAAPVFRGRKLQRMLCWHRFNWGLQRARSVAYTIVRTTNQPSLRNNRAMGYQRVLRFDLFHCAGGHLTFIRRLTHRLPSGRWRFLGVQFAPSLRWTRDRDPQNAQISSKS